MTSNDSRVRLYNLKDHEMSCKYKGYRNTSSQIKATFSRDGRYIISGSEDKFIYIWKTHLDASKLSSARRDRNEFYECFSGETHEETNGCGTHSLLYFHRGLAYCTVGQRHS